MTGEIIIRMYGEPVRILMCFLVGFDGCMVVLELFICVLNLHYTLSGSSTGSKKYMQQRPCEL